MSTWDGTLGEDQRAAIEAALAHFSGPNAGYVLDLYDQFLSDPASVDPATRAYFAAVAAALPDASAAPAVAPAPVVAEVTPATPSAPTPAPERTAERDAAALDEREIARIVSAARLARGIREYGHLAAAIDPLGGERPGDPMLDVAAQGLTADDLHHLPGSIVFPHATGGTGTCAEALARLRGLYEGPIGYDFDHVQRADERVWLIEAIESDRYRAPLTAADRRALLQRLTEVEEFERFLHTTFQGQKRFSIEGTDMLVPMLDQVIADAAAAGTREVLLGMAHRGRLNVLAHVLRKPYAKIFSEFHAAPNKELVPSEGSTGINYGWTGDVKYHLGAQKVVREGDLVDVRVTLAHNPSHLEFVNPVVEGFARAAQERRDAPGVPRQDTSVALPVVIHGDAAFPGEGVVAETLNLSRLAGYQTGGTVHLIANNQIGFTTEAAEGRSTLYASDLAKGFEIPVLHVNADDPEACIAAMRMAHAYRSRFGKDALIDLVGYRRWGHNEGDEPAFTQPQMYAYITAHPTVRALYADALIREGVASAEEAEAWRGEVRARLKAAYDEMRRGHVPPEETELRESPPISGVRTAVSAGALRAFNEALLVRPEGFTPHQRLERLLQRRRGGIEQPGGIDWAHAESLAFASILADGTPIRLTGQDAERGTFSQRHLVLHDAQTGARYVPLQALPQARAPFAVYNSPLSEAAVLGFEYGYSVHAPETLVLWEAQFGDFANAGQVLIDQFIAAARSKWRQHPGLVLLLPHGYEGQGPEHSSGRVERYLQLAAEDNLRVANCTTAAQYFHLLRAQARLLAEAPRPLVVMTPKSLLRHPRAAASLDDLADGGFRPVLEDAAAATHRARVERLVLCSGKVGVDLASAEHGDWVATARVELLYPFPAREMRALLARYPNLREVVWTQEEPRNMGAWAYVAPHLRDSLREARPDGGADIPLHYVGRPEHASTAEGSAMAHAAEQARIVEEAFAGERAARVGTADTRGGNDVG